MLRALILPFFTFIRHYLWRMGILDGIPGLVIALVSSWGCFLKYFKARELRRSEPDRIIRHHKQDAPPAE
jgi:hypothetical protein